MRGLGVILCSLLLLGAVAASDTFPEYPVLSASQYSSCQTKDGVRVAVEPVNEKEEQKKYFGTTFGSAGFLPVLIILENASEGSSLLLRRDLVTYSIEDDHAKGYSAGSPAVGSKAGERVMLAGGLALSLPTMIIAAKMISGASKVKQNILVKELRSQTVAPGKSGSGFLYVPIGKTGAAKLKVILTLPLSLDDKQEALAFTFDLEVARDGK
jgi:hypothetical protein